MPAIAIFLGALVSAALTHKPSRPEFKFAPDSALEGGGFEPPVPRQRRHPSATANHLSEPRRPGVD